MLTGTFNSLEELTDFNSNKDLSGKNSEILYKAIYHNEKGEYHNIIETIFTNE